jgi:hypothetical protein
MALPLKADTITEVTVGPAVAVGDGFTPVTGLTIAGADEAEIIKHGATTTTTIAGTLAAITGADGYYALDLSATDTDTEGRLVLLINDDSLILPIRHEFIVYNANVYDSLFGAAGTDVLDVNTTQVGGTVQTAGDIIADTNDIQSRLPAALVGGAMDSDVSALQANVITAAATATDFGTEIATAVWDRDATLSQTAGTFGETVGDSAALGTTIHAMATSILEDTGTTIPGTITTLQSDTDDIQTRLPAALVGGAMDCDVSAMQANVITASALAADAVTEITDDIMAEVLTEPAQAIPPTTGVADVHDALRYLYFALTNRVDVDDTAGFKEFYNRAESAVNWKKAISDSGTIYTEDTGAAGP